ncbi:MAG: ABC transporter permease [Vicinamibacteria bacterium]
MESLVSRELKARYRGSVLGFVWSFINPLLNLLTYGIVFGYVLPGQRPKEMEPYLLFFACGILPWTFFEAAVLEASSVLVSSGGLLKKVLFPPEILPTVSVITNLVNFFLSLPILLFFVVWNGRLTTAALLFPLPLLVQSVMALGLALALSALTVHFRDLSNIIGHVFRLWFFASPILYLYSQTPGKFKELLRFNPMSHIIVSYQQMLFDGHFDHWKGLGMAALVAIVIFALGCFIFDRLRDALSEEL